MDKVCKRIRRAMPAAALGWERLQRFLAMTALLHMEASGGLAHANFRNNFSNTRMHDLNLVRIGFPAPTHTSTTDAAACNKSVMAPVIGQYEIIATPIPETAAATGGVLCGRLALRRRRIETTSTVPA